jgi:hypothetical protein
VFHIEVRQFPNVGRSFNLSAVQLDEQILKPWLGGRVVVLDERRFAPEKAKLTIYEGPRLRPEEMGLGRGWANVTRSGEDVTQRLVSMAHRDAASADPLRQFKQEVVERSADGMAVRDVLLLADRRHPQSRLSDRLALAERAIWELLHGGELQMLRDGSEVASAGWEPLLLARETWSDSAVSLRPCAD